MARDYGRLQLQTVIVHDVPRRLAREDTGNLQLSEIESQLDDGLRNFLRERVAESLGNSAYEVVFDPSQDPTMRNLVNRQIDGGDLVEISQAMARHLHACQTGVSPAGLLIAAQGSFEGRPCSTIIKLEREEGTLVNQTSRSGQRTYDLQYVRNLMLTTRTRVFKAGLFWQEPSHIEITGVVSDQQRGRRGGGGVAAFFLSRFLGCRPRVDPGTVTRMFLEASESFINSEVDDAQVRGAFEIALLAELGSNDEQLQPRAFAERHLPAPLRAPYVRHLEEAEVPLTAFDKDIGLIAPRIKRAQWQFESGLALNGPPQAFDNHVQFEAIDGGEQRVAITDRLKNVRGRA